MILMPYGTGAADYIFVMEDLKLIMCKQVAKSSVVQGHASEIVGNTPGTAEFIS